jgi:transcriptional regulator of arginine metabolism
MRTNEAAQEAETWQERQDAIRRIVSRSRVSSQEELCEKLAAKGFEVTQSSVSRDLAEMKIVKMDGAYVLPQALGAPPAGPEALDGTRVFLRSVKTAGPNLLVVKTTPGAANAVGMAIDQAQWAEIVGTIAGDDTLLIIVGGKREQKRIETRIEALLAAGG